MKTRLADVLVRFSADITDLRSKMSMGERSIAKFGERTTAVGRGMSLFLTAPILAAGAAATRMGTQMDSLMRGLTAVSGSTGAAYEELKRLREVAKLPGLGLREAVQGATNLRAAGFSADLARRSLMAFGNALATVGRGKEDLDGVNRALSQIASKGKISAEEINQLAERVPQIRRIMQQAFGTADTEKLQRMGIQPAEFIEKIVAELEKLPRVSGGAQNAFENFSDTIFLLGNRIGSVLLPAVTAGIAKLGMWAVRAFAARSSTVAWGVGIAGALALIGPATLGIGHMVTAATSLAAALKVGLLPLLGVGGAIVLGLSALVAWLIKSKLQTQLFAAGVTQAANEIAGSAIARATTPEKALAELGRARMELERRKQALLTLGNKARGEFSIQGNMGGTVTRTGPSAETTKAIKDATQAMLAQAGAVRELEQHYISLSGAMSDVPPAGDNLDAKLAQRISFFDVEIDLGRKTLQQKLQWLDRELAAVKEFTTEWVTLHKERKQVIEQLEEVENAAARAASKRHAQRMREAEAEANRTANQERFVNGHWVKGPPPPKMRVPSGLPAQFSSLGIKPPKINIDLSSMRETVKSIFNVEKIANGIVSGLATSGLNKLIEGFTRMFVQMGEDARLRRENTRALDRLRQGIAELGEALGTSKGANIAGVQQAAQLAMGIANPRVRFLTFRAELARLGLTMENATEIAKAFGIELGDKAEGLGAFAEALREFEFDQMFRSVSGQLNLLQKEFQLFGTKPIDQLRKVRDVFLDAVQLPDSIENELRTIDLSSSVGVTEFRERLRELFKGMTDLTPEQLGQLSLTEFLDIIMQMNGLTESLDGFADATNKATESLRNVPSGFKIALERFNATSGVAVPAGARMGSAGAGDVFDLRGSQFYGVTDIGDFYDRLEREKLQRRRRGSAKAEDL